MGKNKTNYIYIYTYIYIYLYIYLFRYTVLKDKRAFTKRFIDLEDGTVIYCYAFKEAQTKYWKTYLCVCSLDRTLKEESALRQSLLDYVVLVLLHTSIKLTDLSLGSLFKKTRT